ncbi:flagellar FlbD family protein [Alicyclobacillus contaminans]|uniref:flagellar FlbD family protein n=1 Tax=Alicyclobacillus contaminans TaxID=392016 RepID=UPI0004799E8C|nr:flagellar FlbD family protein [Alicyclobacillus contaminans]
MIALTRLNGSELWLSPLLIESMEHTPDTVITLTNGHKYVVRESTREIAQQVVQFYRSIGLAAAAAGKEELE